MPLVLRERNATAKNRLNFRRAITLAA